jgi:hypothetical protein
VGRRQTNKWETLHSIHRHFFANSVSLLGFQVYYYALYIAQDYIDGRASIIILMVAKNTTTIDTYLSVSVYNNSHAELTYIIGSNLFIVLPQHEAQCY